MKSEEVNNRLNKFTKEVIRKLVCANGVYHKYALEIAENIKSVIISSYEIKLIDHDEYTKCIDLVEKIRYDATVIYNDKYGSDYTKIIKELELKYIN